MPSELPDRAASVGIVAGSGALPFAVADQLIAQGRRPFILGLRGFCDSTRIAAYAHDWLAVAQVGRLARLLRHQGCRDVIFIGGLVRPALSELRFDLGTVLAIPKILAAYRGGDDHLLSGVGTIAEGYGLRVVGIRDVAPDLTVPEGHATRRVPNAAELADIDKGARLLRAMSPFDVGQSAIVINGNVACVEDIAGTDGLLARAARLRTEGRLRAPSGQGVLVKMPKAGQNLNFDMPTIGPQTVAGAREAGLAGIAVAAGKTLFAEPQQAITAADQAGLFLTGFADE